MTKADFDNGKKANNSKPLVTIFTCIYNRKTTIQRVFSSVKYQTYCNIEHVLVDDGSSDGIQSVLERYAVESSYPVKIIYKKNGGKHTATNVAWDIAEGEYVIQLDSDDELLPDAVEYMVDLWMRIPAAIRSQYWCVQARCCTQNNKRIYGDPYPEDINLKPFDIARSIASSTKGEKVGLMKRAVLDHYRYPTPAGVKFVSESVVWKQINLKYRTWYSNRIVRVYYVEDGDSLAKQKMSRQTLSNRCWNAKWNIRHRKKYKCKWMKELIRYCYYYYNTTDIYKINNPYRICDFKDDPLIFVLSEGMKLPCFLGKKALAKHLKLEENK